jgi:hypothetical protein
VCNMCGYHKYEFLSLSALCTNGRSIYVHIIFYVYVFIFTVKAEFLFSLGREARCTLAATEASVAVSASCHQHALALPRGIFFVIFSAQKAADAHTYCYIKIIDATHHAENHRVRAQFQRRQRQKGEEKKWLNFLFLYVYL